VGTGAMQPGQTAEAGCPTVAGAEKTKGGELAEVGPSPPPVIIDIAGERRTVAAKRIVVIDERAFRRECVVRMLREVSPEYSFAALARPRDLSAEIPAPNSGEGIDVVILDIGWTRLPDERVAADVRFLLECFGEVPIILLSDREDSAHVAEALNCGVRGFIPTTLGPGVVAEAVRLVGAGGTFIPASALVHALTARPDIMGRSRAGGTEAVGLTPRECEVLNLLREGKPNKIIAAALDLKETTVKIHVRSTSAPAAAPPSR
jgi:DNA-binding NarL/FixJ family response regulator